MHVPAIAALAAPHPTHRLLRVLASMIFPLLAVGLVACSSAPKKVDPISVELAFSASVGLNPDLNGRASPVQISVLKLRKSAAFLTADYFTLADADNNALDGEILSRESFVIEPGESVRKAIRLESGETAIGVLVGFRDMEHSVWRASIDLSPPARKSWLRVPDFISSGKKVIKYTVTLDDQAVRLVPGAEGK